MAWTQEDKDRLRFAPERYALLNASSSRPSQYVPQRAGLYPFPVDDGGDRGSSSSSDDPVPRLPQGLPLLPIE
jgi:hypothetical protein